jgi:hypothetical protein
MPDDIDALLCAALLTPPSGFAQRVTMLAHTVPQRQAPPHRRLAWQVVSLAAGAGAGTLLLSHFLLFAFVAVGAQ